MPRTCLEDVWKLPGRCLEGVLNVSGIYLEGVFEMSWRCPAGIRKISGTCVKSMWKIIHYLENALTPNFVARVFGVAVGFRSGSRLATTLVATIFVIIFFPPPVFSFFFVVYFSLRRSAKLDWSAQKPRGKLSRPHPPFCDPYWPFWIL